MRAIKTSPGVDTSLTGDYKIRAEDGLELFKTIHGNLRNFQLFITEVVEHVTRLILPCTTKTIKQNRPAHSCGTQLWLIAAVRSSVMHTQLLAVYSKLM